MDCTTTKLLVALGLILVARWYGVSSMSHFFILPTLQALCLFQKLGRTMMLLRGLCAARRLPAVQQFLLSVCSAVEVDPLDAGCVVILFFNKLIKLVWIKYQFTVGTEYLAVSSVNKRPDRGSLLDKVYWLNYSVLESSGALSKKQRGSPDWTFLHCSLRHAWHTCWWHTSRVLHVVVPALDEFAFGSGYYEFNFFLTGIYSGEENLKFTTRKPRETSEVVIASS